MSRLQKPAKSNAPKTAETMPNFDVPILPLPFDEISGNVEICPDIEAYEANDTVVTALGAIALSAVLFVGIKGFIIASALICLVLLAIRTLYAVTATTIQGIEYVVNSIVWNIGELFTIRGMTYA